MTEPAHIRPSTSRALALGMSLLALGMALNVVSGAFDGFVRGLLLGAAVTVILLGVSAMSGPLRRQLRRRGEPADAEPADAEPWLPSRDGDR